MYTKGEWKVEYQQYEDGSHVCVADQNGDWVADCGREGHLEAEANANLIAAAPDLYEALVRIDNDICFKCEKARDCNPSECESHMRMMSAILKAEGRNEY